MKAPIVEPTTAIQVSRRTRERRRSWRRDAGRQCLAAGVDGRLDRHAGAQQPASARAVVEHDLHRDALHDLGEVAGGVVGRQQRELEAAGRRQAVDMALAASRRGRCRPRSSTGWPGRTWVSCVSL